MEIGEAISYRLRSVRPVIERPYNRHQRVNGAQAADPGGLGTPVALTEAGIGEVHVLHLGVDTLAVGIQCPEVVEPRVRHLDDGSVHRRATPAQACRLPTSNEAREERRLAALREPDNAQLEHDASHTRRDRVAGHEPGPAPVTGQPGACLPKYTGRLETTWQPVRRTAWSAPVAGPLALRFAGW